MQFSAFDWHKFPTPDLSISERFALIYLKQHTFNERAVAHVSVARMMAALGASRRYLFFILEKLKRLKYITAVGHTAKGVVEYFVNWPKTMEKSYPQGVNYIAPLGFVPGEPECTGGVNYIAPPGGELYCTRIKEVKYELKETHSFEVSKTQTLTSKAGLQDGGGMSTEAQNILRRIGKRKGITPEVGESMESFKRRVYA